jgi:LuxR family maltose regulon positive regulatory protein
VTLERLDRANLFVVPLDDQRRWYRYHHLFADVLRARLLGERPELAPELHRRASDWYDGNGDWADAIGHAIAGADFESAARLIELATPAMRQSRQESTLRSWLELLPEALFDDRPVLGMTLVGARMGTGDPTGVEALLQTIERWIPAEPNTPSGPIVFDRAEFSRLPAQVAMYRAGLALLEGDLPSTIGYASLVFDLAEPTDHVRLGAASALSGLAHWATGALVRAGALYADAVERFIAAAFIPDALGCSLALADIQLAQGSLREARRTFERGLSLADGQPGLRGTADMHIGLSELALDGNDLEGAARHQQLAREHGDAAGLPQNPYRWRVAAARLLHARSDTGGALQLLDDAARVYTTDFSPPVRPVPAVKARLQIHDGDLDAASAWAATRGLRLDDAPDYVHEYEHLTLARLELARHRFGQGRIEPVVDLLGRIAAAAQAGARTGILAEARLLLALAHDARGDRAAASSALDEALIQAAAPGYVRLFLDEGAPLVALLQTAALSADGARHATHILGTLDDGAPRPSRTGLIDELSARELDVLRLLRSDLSGPDIARELLVSLNTLRTHTKRIYAKLGVNSRRAAIRRAADLRL